MQRIQVAHSPLSLPLAMHWDSSPADALCMLCSSIFYSERWTIYTIDVYFKHGLSYQVT